ncbi:MAG: MetQ/NlpA family ABC transporter substrate-binding protein [Oscillospiraceae bacterium]|nr:MetQ/NlpA family ABC transporter substrate-binding protein [Oscillospiraceae bacterium]
MKKTLALLLALVMLFGVLAGCSSSSDSDTAEEETEATVEETTDAAEDTEEVEEAEEAEESTELVTIRVGASPTPHAEILEIAKAILAEQGYDLEIVEYTDYVQPNLAVDSGDLDANYFQHQPYLTTFNEENGTDLVSVGSIHYEPFGIYAGKTASIEELAEGATIAIPNDGSNETRALLLLQQEGVITLADGIDASSNATIYDIVDNPLNIEFVEMEAAQIANSLSDVDLGVINGNYALDAGLNAATDALAIESADGDAAQTYANIVAVKAGNEDNEAIQALVAALQSEEVREYIEETYSGAVVAIF